MKEKLTFRKELMVTCNTYLTSMWSFDLGRELLDEM